MAKSYSISEQTDSVGIVELFITDSLLKEGTAIIPDFGHLEIKSLDGRRTVLFKPTESSDSFLRIMSAGGEKDKKSTNTLYTSVSIPLKEGKTVNLPKIGVFRPVVRDTGEIHVSFILSSYLRKLINEEGNIDQAKEKEIVSKKEFNEIKESEKQLNLNLRDDKIETQEAKKDEIPFNKIQPLSARDKTTTTEPVKRQEITRYEKSSSHKRSTPQIGDTIVPDDNATRKHRSKNLSEILLFLAVIVTIIVVLAMSIHSRNNKKAEERIAISVPSESINLPALAESHYGHSAFWVYIYQANMDKLNSPINISKNVSLIFPDLKTDYDVDVTDSMEIQRANILSDILLKEKIGK